MIQFECHTAVDMVSNSSLKLLHITRWKHDPVFLSIQGYNLITYTGYDTRNPCALTMTLNTDRGKKEKSIVVFLAEGGCFYCTC